jgi:hydroxymethylbilane synthase
MRSWKLKLGTRRSALALAQSGWVARAIAKITPGVEVELVGIETRGDRILDTPLSQVQGKEFFVAEIDEALLSGAVDLTVHSMKDLSLERPQGLKLAAAPRRENPRDVLLFSARAREKLRKGKAIKIGTSSPRRLENIPPFLSKALPQDVPGQRPLLEFVEIRGNVNTRLRRLKEPDADPRALDAVVLAMAGLIRLWKDDAGFTELSELLQDVRWMVLPLAECPTAPAQGMLAVECRADDKATFEIVNQLHDDRTFAGVQVERGLLRTWGGGCHQKFGATQVTHDRLGDLLYVRGRLPDESLVDELRWLVPEPPTGPVRAWDGTTVRGEVALKAKAGALIEKGAVFAASSRALDAAALGSETRIWTSGTASWFKLASQGYWVEGCAEGMGFEYVKPMLLEPVLQLPPMPDWSVLTHDDAVSGWEAGQVTGTYRVGFESANTQDLHTATHVFWSSSTQFEALVDGAAASAHHACGPGKTARRIEASGLMPTVFPSVEEWRRWIKI